MVCEASPATDLIFLRPPPRRTSDIREIARASEGVRGRSGIAFGRVLFWDRDRPKTQETGLPTVASLLITTGIMLDPLVASVS